MRRRSYVGVGYVAVVTACVCGAGVARADEPSEADRAVLLLQVFEGHGVSKPHDAEKARAMEVWTQRAAAMCANAYLERGGGTGSRGAVCAGVDDPGPDAASAILDTLNDLRTSTTQPRFTPRFEFLARTLGDSGRADVVPSLVRALHRLALRARFPEVYNRKTGPSEWTSRMQDVASALEALTLTKQNITTDRWNDPNWPHTVVAAWQTWFDAHGREPRATWEQRALQDAEDKIVSRRESSASDALVIVLRDASTRSRALALVPAYRKTFGKTSSEIDGAMKRRRQ